MHRKFLHSVTFAFLLFISLSQLFVQVVEADGSWVWVRNTVTGAYGEAVVGTDDAVYVARKTSFYRYNPADNSWTDLADPPNPDASDAFKTGTALAWDLGDYIYALYGAATGDSRRWFYRYSISSNSWGALTNTTADQGEGDAITWVDIDNCIYATIGGEQRPTYFMRYDPSTNSWSDVPADPPAGMGDGASLVWTGGDFLYALRGEFDEESPLCDFWRYSLSGDVWTPRADISADAHDGGVGGVGDGGSLLYVGYWLSNQTDYIYALSGNQAYPDGIPDNRTYRYTVSMNSWERLADLPFGVGYYVGCRLGYADGHIYAWQGAPGTWEGGGDDLAYYEFPVAAHDLAINLTLSNHEVYVGENVTITVAVKNEGTHAEGLPCIHAYADSVFNQTLCIYLLLEPGEIFEWNFTWNTVNASSGNYTITAEVEVVPGEIDTADNVAIDYVYARSDNMPPRIGTPIQYPTRNNVQPYQNVTVCVNITDLESGVKNASLLHSTNESGWISKPMTLNSTTNMYEATIPGFPAGTQIKYMIIAYDKAGNPKTEDKAGQYYVYTVIPEFPSFLILPLFMIATLLAVIVYRRKHSM